MAQCSRLGFADVLYFVLSEDVGWAAVLEDDCSSDVFYKLLGVWVAMVFSLHCFSDWHWFAGFQNGFVQVVLALVFICGHLVFRL
jgi:hypothetical protein